MAETVSEGFAPALNDRARGWLRFLWRKATTPDDWSEDGTPHPWWDQSSTEPMCDFPRFDLSESSYALGIMADRTPAWREVYATILEQLVERHLTYWAAIDWITHIGPDPRRGDYPQEWIDLLIPPHLVGEYDTPGWCANGVEPWGLQPDPIGAEGNLFFKGWLNLTMSLHAYVSGEDRWTQPFQVAGIDRARFEWTQHGVTEHLAEQWARHPAGLHCENTKVWPYCLSAAGLGLQLYDAIFKKDTHQVFHQWLENVRDDYFGFNDKGELEWTCFYYDPIIEHKQTLGPGGGLGVCLYMMAQDPALGEALYHGAVNKLGWNDPAKQVRAPNDPRFLAVTVALAREYGDDVTLGKLNAYAEEHYEPRRFGPTNDEFGWWFQFGEDWPRGQLSALLAMGEVGSPGAWTNLFRNPNLEKFSQPTVEGVDFPTVGISRAWNDLAQGVLRITTYAADSSKAGGDTRFRVTQLPDASLVAVRCDGAPTDKWRQVDGTTIELDSTVAAHEFEIITGIGAGEVMGNRHGQAHAGGGGGRFDARPPATSLPVQSISLSQGMAMSAGPSCPCCVG